MERMKMESPNLEEKNIDKLELIFPNVITETKLESGETKKAVDFEKLKELLSDYLPEEREKYEFTWPGKKEAIAESQRSLRKTLRPMIDDSVNWNETENLYIEGDNLDVLKLLQESYMGKISLIYIDPPYNTGNDFIYPDSFKLSNSKFDELTDYYDEDGNVNYKKTNSSASPRYHSDWCSMIYSRLLLSRNLLEEKGLVFISIDENEITNLRKICDEIFGENQFVAQITLLCNPKGRSQDMYLANCHEYLLVYSKSPLNKGELSIPKSEEEIKADYPLIDENGPYRELELRNTHREFGRFNRPNLYYPIYVDESGQVSITQLPNFIPIFPNWDDGFEGCWTWGRAKAISNSNLLSAKNVKGKWKIYRKAYAYEDGNQPLKMAKSIWNDKKFYTEKGQKAFDSLFPGHHKLFQSPKSVELIKQCIQMCHKTNGIILDFFSGSGTTGQAVIEQNKLDGGKRNFILVQLPEVIDGNNPAAHCGLKTISELGRLRLKKIGESIDQSQVDVGFRAFSVDSSNMKDVYYCPDNYKQEALFEAESNIKEDRTDLDLLFGCVLDSGLELSKPYKSEKIGDVSIHIYHDRKNVGAEFIACFAENVPENVIREIAKRKPIYAIFRDSGFENDAARVNLTEIFKLLSPDTEVKVL